MTEQPPPSSDTLYERFLRGCEQEHLFRGDTPVLVAVSGGVDSVVLAHLIAKAGIPFSIAHCNFHLRGDESDRDELFTQNLAHELGVEMHTEHFNTHSYAFNEGISIEMAARDLRYAWFSQLLKQHSYQCVATGHHADDQIETLLLNLIRGTGISGLRGMLPKTGQVVRPLLPFFRNEIQQYASANQIGWIEDTSNQEVEIRRNRIRHMMMPLVEEINPNYRMALLRTVQHIREAEIIYREKVEEKLATVVIYDRHDIKVSIPGLKSLKPLSTYLFELLSPYGFNASTLAEIEKGLDAISGKQYFSPSHRVVKDRDELIITVKSSTDDAEHWQYFLHEETDTMTRPLRLKCKTSTEEEYTLTPDPSTAALDFHKLTFPLTLRKWQTGDAFVPLGMQNRKKLSDLFSDLKLSLPEKERVWVILSGEQIVWVVGYRIDNRYRITEQTRTVFSITVE